MRTRGIHKPINAKSVRNVLLEICRGQFYHHNGIADHKAVYLLNIENAFSRLGIYRKPGKTRIDNAGDSFTKAQVEQMLSDAMGVGKDALWAELGARTGFGKRIA